MYCTRLPEGNYVDFGTTSNIYVFFMSPKESLLLYIAGWIQGLTAFLLWNDVKDVQGVFLAEYRPNELQ